jgi:hypothetical protein
MNVVEEWRTVCNFVLMIEMRLSAANTSVKGTLAACVVVMLRAKSP